MAKRTTNADFLNIINTEARVGDPNSDPVRGNCCRKMFTRGKAAEFGCLAPSETESESVAAAHLPEVPAY